MSNGNSISELTNKVWAAADAMRAEGLLITDYMEQLSLFMFLKMLQEREDSEREQAEVLGGTPTSLFDDEKYKWGSWSQLNGPMMREFLVHELFPYLQDRPGIVGKVFRDVALAIEDPGTLKAVVGVLDSVNLTAFGFDAMGQMYEHFLRRLAEAGAAGEYFTYRHIIDFMIQMVDPKLEETIYDPAFGTCGFLTRALEWIKTQHGGGKTLRASEWEFLRGKAFWGHEVNRRTYRMGLLNMYLHGIDEPNLERIDTLGPGTHVGRKYDVVLSNPPYGAKVVKENVRPDFAVPSIKSQLLFLQHIMQSLAPGGRAAMIADEGLYFQGGAFARVRQLLLEQFDVRAVVSLPAGIFLPYTGVKASVVFFWNTGEPTKEVWFYELQSDGSSLSEARRFGHEFPDDIPDLLEKWGDRPPSERSWLVAIDEIERNDWNLTVARYNPAPSETLEHERPDVLIRQIVAIEQMIQEELKELLDIMAETTLTKHHARKPLGELVDIVGGGTPAKGEAHYWNGPVPWVSPKDMKSWELFDSIDHITEEAVEQSAARWIDANTVLVVVRGMILARAFPVAIGRTRLTINQDMKALRPRDDLLPEFLAYVLLASEKEILAKVETASHGTRRLPTQALMSVPIPAAPLEEQRRFIDQMSLIRKKVETLRSQKTDSERLLTATFGAALDRAL